MAHLNSESTMREPQEHTKSSKTPPLTVEAVRAAAEALRGTRPAGKFLAVSPKRSKQLHDQFLGDIVRARKSVFAGKSKTAKGTGATHHGARKK